MKIILMLALYLMAQDFHPENPPYKSEYQLVTIKIYPSAGNAQILIAGKTPESFLPKRNVKNVSRSSCSENICLKLELNSQKKLVQPLL